jgi:hypothetical protein
VNSKLIRVNGQITFVLLFILFVIHQTNIPFFSKLSIFELVTTAERRLILRKECYLIYRTLTNNTYRFYFVKSLFTLYTKLSPIIIDSTLSVKSLFTLYTELPPIIHIDSTLSVKSLFTRLIASSKPLAM